MPQGLSVWLHVHISREKLHLISGSRSGELLSIRLPGICWGQRKNVRWPCNWLRRVEGERERGCKNLCQVFLRAVNFLPSPFFSLSYTHTITNLFRRKGENHFTGCASHVSICVSVLSLTHSLDRLDERSNLKRCGYALQQWFHALPSSHYAGVTGVEELGCEY